MARPDGPPARVASRKRELKKAEASAELAKKVNQGIPGDVERETLKLEQQAWIERQKIAEAGKTDRSKMWAGVVVVIAFLASAIYFGSMGHFEIARNLIAFLFVLVPTIGIANKKNLAKAKKVSALLKQILSVCVEDDGSSGDGDGDEDVYTEQEGGDIDDGEDEVPAAD